MKNNYVFIINFCKPSIHKTSSCEFSIWAYGYRWSTNNKLCTNKNIHFNYFLLFIIFQLNICNHYTPIGSGENNLSFIQSWYFRIRWINTQTNHWWRFWLNWIFFILWMYSSISLKLNMLIWTTMQSPSNPTIRWRWDIK